MPSICITGLSISIGSDVSLLQQLCVHTRDYSFPFGSRQTDTVLNLVMSSELRVARFYLIFVTVL